MGTILEAAAFRKRENDRRMERKIQKERESEDPTIADKEAFVTEAYTFLFTHLISSDIEKHSRSVKRRTKC